MKQAVVRAVQAADYPTLPGRNTRDDVVRVLTKIAPRIGLKSGALRALLEMINKTPYGDWKDPSTDPVCYMEQIKVADISGIKTRSLRNYEALWERMGLVLKDVGADGSRGCFGGGKLKHGINFRPLIEHFDRFRAMAMEADAEAEECHMLRRRCTAARRTFNRLLAEICEANPEHPDLQALLQIKAELPRRYEGLGKIELIAVFEAVDNVARKVTSIVLDQTKMTCEAAKTDRPHIQDTIDLNTVICSASDAEITTDRDRSEDTPHVSPQPSVEKCLEDRRLLSDRGHKPKFTETFSPRQLYWMASDDMRMYLDAQRRGQSLAITEHELIQAAISILPALGVHGSAWDEAVEAMGELAAALSVLIIDANRFHPEKPIHSTGATLRTFARLARADRLNLHGSLIGLKQRMEAKRGTGI